MPSSINPALPHTQPTVAQSERAVASHTPGPWTVERDVEVYSADSRPIADCIDNADFTKAQCAANARLISAAPELLEALEDALEHLQGYEDVRDGADGKQLPNDAMSLCTRLRAVIAKARGQSCS